MLGYDISWAAFNIIEVMSSSKFTFKVSAGFVKRKFDFKLKKYQAALVVQS